VKEGTFPASAASTEFSFKLNHQLTDAHALSARHAFSRGRTSNDVQGLDNFDDRSARGSSLTQDHSEKRNWPEPSLSVWRTAPKSIFVTLTRASMMMEPVESKTVP
jgi:hypothetical protein